MAETRIQTARKIYKALFAVMLASCLLGWMAFTAYCYVPKRELEAAERALAASSCSNPASVSPPDDAWREANAHLKRVDAYRYFADEDFALAKQVEACCIQAYLRAEDPVRLRAVAAMDESNRQIPLDSPTELGRVKSDWHDFVSAEDRAALCNGPWNECRFRDPSICR